MSCLNELKADINCVSFPEKSGTKNFNMTALMGRKGEILYTYRKQKPTKPGDKLINS